MFSFYKSKILFLIEFMNKKIDYIIQRLLQKQMLLRKESEDNYPYQSPSPGKLPIIADSPFPMNCLKNKDLLNKSHIKTICECGFNVGMELVGDEFLDKVLTLIPESGESFKFLPASSSLHDEKFHTFLAKYKSNENIGGWNFKDEPKLDEIDVVWDRYRDIIAYDPNHLVYINLIGSASGNNNPFTGNMEYSEYVEMIQDLFTPGLWSYDLYPVRINVYGNLSVQYRQFYMDLHIFSKIAKETNRPFWAYVQSMEFMVTSNKSGCPAPKEEYMRYEAFNALAFGAQGIVYWTYALRNNPISESEAYSTALVDRSGNKTEYWYYAQKVNAEIRKFEKIFYGCKLIKYAHVGNLGSDVWDIIPPVSVSNFGPIEGVTSRDKGAVITILNNVRQYLIFVNHSPLENSIIDITFLSEYEVKDLTNCVKPDFSDSTTMHAMSFILKPGGYKICEFRRKGGLRP